jgi:RimJ/RimL family protein N-acetyltransferase
MLSPARPPPILGEASASSLVVGITPAASPHTASARDQRRRLPAGPAMSTESPLPAELARLRAARQEAISPQRPTPTAALPDGRTLRLDRSRWDGPLDPAELAWCRANGVEVAYDCAQIGWVIAGCPDDETLVTANAPHDAMSDPEAEARQLRTRRIAADAANAPDTGHDDILRDFAARHGVRAASGLHFALALDRFRHAPAPSARTEPPTPTAAAFTFRPWAADDAPTYRALLDNPRLWQYLPEPFPTPLTEALARTLIEVGTIPGRQETLAVLHDGRPIGQALLRFDAPFVGVRAAEVAYWLGEAHWGKGWMTRILTDFLALSFAAHRLDVVYAWIHDDNRASARVAERCGLGPDPFPLAAELAHSLQRPRFHRFVRYRRER